MSSSSTRNAWLKGLSPKENREIPPLRYDVAQLKRDFPQLTIAINGGIATDAVVQEQLQHVDGVMVGARPTTTLVAQPLGRVVLWRRTQHPLPREVEEPWCAIWSGSAKHGTGWYSIARHMLGLRHGMPGARRWRQVWSDHRLKQLPPAKCLLSQTPSPDKEAALDPRQFSGNPFVSTATAKRGNYGLTPFESTDILQCNIHKATAPCSTSSTKPSGPLSSRLPTSPRQRPSLQQPHAAFSKLPYSQRMVAAFDLFYRLGKDYEKPEFDIRSVKVNGVDVTIRERVEIDKPFCELRRFKRFSDDPTTLDTLLEQPAVLIVAPLSGHYATLLRDTVQQHAGDHKVYITDWKNARLVPLSEGNSTWTTTSTMCRSSSATCRASTALPCGQRLPAHRAGAGGRVADGQPRRNHAADHDHDGRPHRCAPLADVGEQPGHAAQLRVVREQRDLPRARQLPGAGRRVYPGFLQYTGFVAMNPDRHATSHYDYFKDLIKGDDASAEHHRKFYDEYNAVLDMDADYYLETIATVFQDFKLVNGTWDVVNPPASRARAPAGHPRHRPADRGRRAGRHLRLRPDPRRPRPVHGILPTSASTWKCQAPATTASSAAAAGAKTSTRHCATSCCSTRPAHPPPRSRWLQVQPAPRPNPGTPQR
jgi:hypothetical protein